MPFLTFRTVKGYRKLRQAIRLAEEAHRISPKAKKTQENAISEEYVQKARLSLLRNAIIEGNKLLEKTICGSKRLKLSSCIHGKLQRLQEAVANIEPNDDKSLESKENQKLIAKCLLELSKENLPSEILEWHERLQDSVDIAKQGKKNKRPNDQKGNRLYQQYLKPGQEKGIHTPRSIDQYYYSSLADTSRRDVDQVIRRYQNRKWKEEAEASYGNNKTPDDDCDFQMVMVDQLWLWVIDDSKSFASYRLHY